MNSKTMYIFSIISILVALTAMVFISLGVGDNTGAYFFLVVAIVFYVGSAIMEKLELIEVKVK